MCLDNSIVIHLLVLTGIDVIKGLLMFLLKLVDLGLEVLLHLSYLLSIDSFSLDRLLDLHLSSVTILVVLLLKLFYEFLLHFQLTGHILDVKLLLGESAFELDQLVLLLSHFLLNS
jgi:hypothetical protein